ncbi:MAG: hypothetical protein KKB31_03380 [Nanoarchaeota archaeon]|nr:hypothetical protein [Nanoarchaeota archaeon]
MNKKRGVSPVVATVLLIAMVIVIALIIFLWFKNIGGEVVSKFGQNIELTCGEVEFYADYDNNQVYISNIGTIPIFGMSVKVNSGSSHETKNIINEFDNWDTRGLDQGETYSGPRKSGPYGTDVESLILTPVLLGTTDDGEKTFKCNENQYGKEVLVF